MSAGGSSTSSQRFMTAFEQIWQSHQREMRHTLKHLKSQAQKMQKTVLKHLGQVEEALIAFCSAKNEETVTQRLTAPKSVGALLLAIDEQTGSIAKVLDDVPPVLAVVGAARKLKQFKPEESYPTAVITKATGQRIEMLQYLRNTVIGAVERCKGQLVDAGRWRHVDDETLASAGYQRARTEGASTAVTPLEEAIRGMLSEIESLRHQLHIERDKPSLLCSSVAPAMKGKLGKRSNSPTRTRSQSGFPSAADIDMTDPIGFRKPGASMGGVSPRRAHSVIGQHTTGQSHDTPSLVLEVHRHGTVQLESQGPIEGKGLHATRPPKSKKLEMVTSFIKREEEMMKKNRSFSPPRAHDDGTTAGTAPPQYVPPDLTVLASDVKLAMKHRVQHTDEKMHRFLQQVQNEADPLWREQNRRQEDNKADIVQMLQPCSHNTAGTINHSVSDVDLQDQRKDHAVNRMLERRIKKSMTK
jgi:hypothetical protein